ncbi:MAG: hypothetical protein AABZ12_14455 [Planctomycetota bacterium]
MFHGMGRWSLERSRLLRSVALRGRRFQGSAADKPRRCTITDFALLRRAFPASSRRCAVAGLTAWICLVPPPVAARATVVGAEARVTASVQELLAGQPASFNEDSADYNELATSLPLRALAEIRSTDLGGSLLGAGRSRGDFFDPTRLDQPNPEELAVESACSSNAADVSYLVTSTVTERRLVVFNAPTDGIEFRGDGTQEIRSTIFLSGAVVFWSAKPASESAADPVVELSLRVSRADDPDALYESRVRLAQGALGLAPVVEGTLSTEVADVERLRQLGVIEPSLSVLQPLEDSGSLLILIIPPQEQRYSYEVRADEPVTLVAELEARLTDVSEGSGMAAVLGRPFSELADFIELSLPGVDGQSVQRAVNKAVRNANPPRDDVDHPAGRLLGDVVCGTFGAEALLLLFPLTAMGTSIRRRAERA